MRIGLEEGLMADNKHDIKKRIKEEISFIFIRFEYLLKIKIIKIPDYSKDPSVASRHLPSLRKLRLAKPDGKNNTGL
jgi:hypothetical protein